MGSLGIQNTTRSSSLKCRCPDGKYWDGGCRNPISQLGSIGPLSSLPILGVEDSLFTWEYWGLFQLTGTRTLELEPDEVEDALRVTAMVLGFPSRPEEFCSSSYRLPMMGVLRKKNREAHVLLCHSYFWGIWIAVSQQQPRTAYLIKT